MAVHSNDCHIDRARQFDLEVHHFTDGAFLHQILGEPHFAKIPELGGKLEARARGVRRANQFFGQTRVRGSRHLAQQADTARQRHFSDRVMRSGRRAKADRIKLDGVEHIFGVVVEGSRRSGKLDRGLTPYVAQRQDAHSRRPAPVVEMKLARITKPDDANTEVFECHVF
jgi:hypothetical protein